MLSTPLSRRLGLDAPIVVAPMFLLSSRELILAAAEQGILGTMPSLNARSTEKLREDLAWIRARTERPFGINLTLGLTPRERLEADLEACFEFEVPVLITSYGDPTELVRRAHERGCFVMHDVIHRHHALKAQRAGVDAIIGVAAGAGGHAGDVSPLVLIPHLIEALEIPVVAAGCIHGGSQLAAVLSLGAELAYMGTRFITSEECQAALAYKQLILDAQPEDIVYTDAVSGIHANFLKSTLPGEGFQASRGADAAKRWRDIWSAGQGSALVHEVQSVERIVEEILREYRDSVARLRGYLT